MRDLVHYNAGPTGLGAARIWVCLLWLVTILWDPIQALAELPVGAVQPVGICRLIPASTIPLLYSSNFLLCLKWTLAALLAISILGVKYARIAMTAAFLLLILHQGLIRSVSFVNHAELNLLYALALLSIFPCCDGLAWRSRTSERDARLYCAPLLAIMLIMSTTYMFVGIERIVYGGIGVFTSESFRLWTIRASLEPHAIPYDWGLKVVEMPGFSVGSKIGFFAVTIVEVLSPICLVSSWFRHRWLIVIAGFHFATCFTMKVFFWENLALLAIFIDSSSYSRWFTNRAIIPPKLNVSAGNNRQANAT